jgi:dihydrofolate synthase / folylpolyglutamate synthase
MAVSRDVYDRAVAAIDAVAWRGIMPGLERTRALLAVLGNPQTGLRGALVGGTNGKGSVCALVDSVCRAAGLRTVLLTKPHLVSYVERYVRDGQAISEANFAELIDEVTSRARELPEELQPTAFEMLTAAGILFASRSRPDVLVCEVGLGGRLDSTNVLDVDVNVITNVALDHQEHLGPTITDIAREKAQIIKPGSVAVTAAHPPALEVIQERAGSVGAPLTVVHPDGVALGRHGVDVTTNFAGNAVRVHSPLIGAFQVGNVATAIATCEALRGRGFAITADDVVRGCATVSWPGRMEWFDSRPAVLIDGAHNPAAMEAMTQSLPELAAGRKTVALFAAMHNKDVRTMAGILARLIDDIVVTAPEVERATPAAELAQFFSPPAIPVAGARGALGVARERAGNDGLVVVCGSLYLAGEVLTVLRGEDGL